MLLALAILNSAWLEATWQQASCIWRQEGIKQELSHSLVSSQLVIWWSWAVDERTSWHHLGLKACGSWPNIRLGRISSMNKPEISTKLQPPLFLVHWPITYYLTAWDCHQMTQRTYFTCGLAKCKRCSERIGKLSPKSFPEGWKKGRRNGKTCLVWDIAFIW